MACRGFEVGSRVSNYIVKYDVNGTSHQDAYKMLSCGQLELCRGHVVVVLGFERDADFIVKYEV